MNYLMLLATTLCLLNLSEAYRIVGGREAKAHSRPYMVSLQMKSQSFCGGALIDPKWVLTAAHCMEDTPVDMVRVVLGAHNLNQPDDFVQVSPVQESFQHPGYNPNTLQNDLQLLKLNTSANITPYVKTIKLPCADTDVLPGTSCSVAGWGYVSDFGTLPRALMETDVNVITLAACNVSWKQSIFDTMICTASQGLHIKGFCSGDSGGPLICEDHVEGVVSFSGFRCGSPITPDVYTRVSSFMSWIKSVINRS
ncbi:serine protease 57 [Aquarana catesbeiana]|uniref:serine protease 57 n=1 Tax=Aquarana catesbeiana TaxID=8400 RepID=UPI003CC9B675